MEGTKNTQDPHGMQNAMSILDSTLLNQIICQARENNQINIMLCKYFNNWSEQDTKALKSFSKLIKDIGSDNSASKALKLRKIVDAIKSDTTVSINCHSCSGDNFPEKMLFSQ